MAVSSLVPAASGPTLAEIQTAVSTYSKGPLDMTWTGVGFVNPNNTASQTITGLGGYKYLKILISNVYFASGTGSYTIRFNGDTTNRNYAKIGSRVYGSGGAVGGDNDSGSYIGLYPSLGSGHGASSIEIFNPTQTGAKKVGRYLHQGWDGSSWYKLEGDFIWSSTAAVTSVTFANTSGSNFVTDSYTTDGFHVFGAN